MLPTILSLFFVTKYRNKLFKIILQIFKTIKSKIITSRVCLWLFHCFTSRYTYQQFTTKDLLLVNIK